MGDVKAKQIEALLNFETMRKLGPLAVSNEEVYSYVQEHGLPKTSPKSGEFCYRFAEGGWFVDHYEKNTNIGTDHVATESEVLDIILQKTIRSYQLWNT